MNAIMTTGNNALTPTNMESAIQLAEMMARGKLVPSHLHNSPGDCLMVIEASMRWQMSPFAVAQCTSVIQGKLMFEGKLVAAALNASGILSARLDYEFSGASQQRAVIVRGTLRGETRPREVTVFLADAKTSNSLWTKQPDQQLVYAGTRVWARRHAPEVMLGVYAPEEFDRAEPFTGPTIDADAPSDARKALNDSIPLRPATRRTGTWRSAEGEDADRAEAAEAQRAAAAATPRAPRKADPEVYDAEPTEKPQRTDEQWEVWIDKLRAACAVLKHRQEVVEIGGKDSVRDAIRDAPDRFKRDISAILAEAFERFPAEPGDDLDEVVIAGEDKILAG